MNAQALENLQLQASIAYTDGFVRGSYFWQDDVQFDTTNNPLHIGGSHSTFDLYTGISSPDGQYTLQFFVQNLFDEFYIVSLSGQNRGWHRGGARTTLRLQTSLWCLAAVKLLDDLTQTQDYPTSIGSTAVWPIV